MNKRIINQIQKGYVTFLGDTPTQRMYNFKLIKKFLDDGLSLAKIAEKFGLQRTNKNKY